MTEYRIQITAKFSEEELKKSLNLETIHLETLSKVIESYILDGKTNKSSLENVNVSIIQDDPRNTEIK